MNKLKRGLMRILDTLLCGCAAVTEPPIATKDSSMTGTGIKVPANTLLPDLPSLHLASCPGPFWRGREESKQLERQTSQLGNCDSIIMPLIWPELPPSSKSLRQALCEDIIRKSISIDNVVQIMMTAKAGPCVEGDAVGTPWKPTRCRSQAHRADGLKDICMAGAPGKTARCCPHSEWTALPALPGKVPAWQRAAEPSTFLAPQDFIITNEEKIKPTPAFKELIQDRPFVLRAACTLPIHSNVTQ